MKKFSAIFLAILLSFNIVSSLRLNPIDASILPSNSIRAQLAQILIQVKQENSPKTIKAFLGQLEGMLNKLQEEQKKHQEISDKMMAQCKEEDEFRAKEVADAKDALGRAEGARTKCEESLKSANKDLPDLKSALETYQEQLKKATEQREAEHKVYEEKKKDYEEALSFLADFTKYVSEHFKGHYKAFSFIEKSELLLRHATKLSKLAEVVPILVHLAQAKPTEDEDAIPAKHNEYKYTPNEDAAASLKNALETLEAAIKKDWQENEDVEKKAQEAFEVLKTKLTEAINTLEANIKKVEQQIKDMAKCVADEDAIMATASKKFSRNEELKESASKMCNQFAEEFTTATKNRLEEIHTMKEILVIVQNRFGKLAADLIKYLDTVETGWVAYVNSTEFKKFEEYQQKHTEKSAHGAELVAEKNLLKF